MAPKLNHISSQKRRVTNSQHLNKAIVIQDYLVRIRLNLKMATLTQCLIAQLKERNKTCKAGAMISLHL